MHNIQEVNSDTQTTAIAHRGTMPNVRDFEEELPSIKIKVPEESLPKVETREPSEGSLSRE